MSQTNILNYDTTPNTNILFCKLVLLFSKNDFEWSKRSHKISFKFQLSSGNGVNYKHLITHFILNSVHVRIKLLTYFSIGPLIGDNIFEN